MDPDPGGPKTRGSGSRTLTGTGTWILLSTRSPGGALLAQPYELESELPVLYLDPVEHVQSWRPRPGAAQ
jgi:hypothetical protein